MAAPVDHPLSWNKTTTSAFIDVLKLHVCLWNIKSESYKNRDLRRAAFRSIIDEFEKIGVTIKETGKERAGFLLLFIAVAIKRDAAHNILTSRVIVIH